MVVAADLWRQARFDFRRRLDAQELTKVGKIFDLIGLHPHNHLPAALLSKADDLPSLLRRSHTDHSRPLMGS